MLVVILLISFSLFILKQRAGHIGQFPDDMPPFAYPTSEKTKAEAPPAAVGFLPTEMEDIGRFEAWNTNLATLGQCLGVEVGTLNAQDDFNIEALHKVLAPAFGEVAKVKDKWTSVDTKSKDGEIRRVFVEYEAELEAPESPANRTVRYYTMLVTGKVRDLRLDGELKDNPSDAAIAKLFEGKQVITEVKSKVATYKNADELHFVERNGKVYSFVANHLRNYFRCTDADSDKMKCSCN